MDKLDANDYEDESVNDSSAESAEEYDNESFHDSSAKEYDNESAQDSSEDDFEKKTVDIFNPKNIKTKYTIALPNELIWQIVLKLPEKQLRVEKLITKSFDKFMEERRKLALEAEIQFLMKGRKEEELGQVKYEMLRLAVKQGFVWKVRQLLVSGVNAEWLKGNKDNLLTQSVDAENNAAELEVIKLLLEHGVPAEGSGALYFAAARGHFDICKLLISHGVDPNLDCLAVNMNNEVDMFWPLHWAACGGHANIVQLLLDKGAKVDIVTSKTRWTPLHWATTNSHLIVAKILLDHAEKEGKKKALLNFQDRKGATALHIAYGNGNLAIAQFMKSQGADKEIKDKKGRKPFELSDHFMSIAEMESVEKQIKYIRKEMECRKWQIIANQLQRELKKLFKQNQKNCDCDEKWKRKLIAQEEQKMSAINKCKESELRIELLEQKLLEKEQELCKKEEELDRIRNQITK